MAHGFTGASHRGPHVRRSAGVFKGTRAWFICALIAALVTSCGSVATQAGSVAPTTARSEPDFGPGVDDQHKEDLRALLREPLAGKDIREIDIVLPSSKAGGQATAKEWVAISSAAEDVVARAQVRWRARILVAALWKRQKDLKRPDLPRGGSVSFDRPTADGDSGATNMALGI
jgi:hypothetical protein